MQSLKATSLAALILIAAAGAFGQNSTADLDQAKSALAAAEAAGAPTYARTLYDDAVYRVRFAQENWNGKQKNQAQMRAIEAIAAARAATAKARWLSTNAAIRTLQEDIVRFGGTSGVTLRDESPSMEINRGQTTKEHIAAAQNAADHLAYRAEMMGRRAYYLARLAESNRALPDIQLQRTRLAQSASERSAA